MTTSAKIELRLIMAKVYEQAVPADRGHRGDRGMAQRARTDNVGHLDWTIWYIIVGVLLVGMALAGTLLKRLPLTTSLLYLLAGVGLGQWGLGLISLDVLRHSRVLEWAAEFAVLVSLFTAGLKLRLPLSDWRWWLPVRLATLSMAVTVLLIAAVGVYLLKLPWGVAIVLGGILAPTDPVLASDVQVGDPADRDRLRFSLTGEAGLNDGTAFPFVMLGLGLMGLHSLGVGGWKWWMLDVAWAVLGGLLIGALAGTGVARLVLYLRRKHKEALGLDEFLSLGLLALSYGVAVWAHAYGFLAVFAAGVALRRVEAASSDGDVPPDVGGVAAAAEVEQIATDPERAPAYMAQAVLGFNEQLERICELAVVLLIGGLLGWKYLPREASWFVPALFLVIRPAAVQVGLLGSKLDWMQRGLVGWFGIRGVGSLYYLTYALHNGLAGRAGELVAGLTLTTIAASIVVHGISVTPLMNAYVRRKSVSTKRGRRQVS